MKSTATTVSLVAVLIVGGVAGHAVAREPSAACDTGEVKPTATPAGLGIRQAGDPYQEPQSIYLCSTSRAPGAVWIRGDTTSNRVHVIVDGNTTNRRTPCTDGYTAARADADGVRLYRADDGDFSFSARDRSAEDWARGTAACLPPSAA